MDTLPAAETRMQAEIEALRAQHPETQDLYREVCVLLFFRYGLTPTANKLYQLVRKGSMSAPAEALARFWETLREKSRVRIEHPDLPEPLRDAAGDLIGALWQKAQVEAQGNLAHQQEEARVAMLAADESAQAAVARASSAEEALHLANADLQTTQETLSGVQAELARAQGELAAQQRQIDAAAVQRLGLQQSLSAVQERFTRELEQQRAAGAAAADRHAADIKRVLVDIDRERGQIAKVQRELDQLRRRATDQAEVHRAQLAERQNQIEELRQKNGALDGSVAELRVQREQLGRDVESLRQRLDNLAAPKATPPRRARRVPAPVKTAKMGN